jgi:hypothetical protein
MYYSIFLSFLIPKMVRLIVLTSEEHLIYRQRVRAEISLKSFNLFVCASVFSFVKHINNTWLINLIIGKAKGTTYINALCKPFNTRVRSLLNSIPVV